MKTAIPFSLCFLYILAVLSLGFLASPVASFWLVVGLSLVFLCAYRALTRGRFTVPLAVIFITTVALPIAFLFYIGLPVYHSWSSTASSLISAFKDYGQFWGLELFAPFLAAAIGALLMRWRSNIAFERDARKSNARPST